MNHLQITMFDNLNNMKQDNYVIGEKWRSIEGFSFDKETNRTPLISKKNMILLQRKSINKGTNRTKIGNSLKNKKLIKPHTKQRWSVDEKDNPQSPARDKYFKKKQIPQIQEEPFRFIKRQFFTPNLSYTLKLKHSSKNSLITPIMRLILVDWLMQLSSQLNISKQAFHSSIYLLDSLLQRITITKNQLQIYGLTCLMIAQKLDSQHCLTPLKAQELMLGMVYQKQFIELQRQIVKLLGYKLHPYTLWSQANIIFIAATSYFKQMIDQNWKICQSKLMWIVQGLVLELSYFEKKCSRMKWLTLRERDLAFSLLFAVVSTQKLSIKPFLTDFYAVLKGNILQFQPIYPCSLNKWLERSCKCTSSASYHPQLRQYAAYSIWNME